MCRKRENGSRHGKDGKREGCEDFLESTNSINIEYHIYPSFGSPFC